MIASIRGTLRSREADTLVIETGGGVGYAVTVPLGVLERIPPASRSLRPNWWCEDGWALYGFDSASERSVFRILLGASGIGPRLALAILSTLGPERAARSIRQRDIATLATVNGIGRKKAEKLVVEIGDRFGDLPGEGPVAPPRPAEEAVQALVRLGYPAPAAEDAIRAALADGHTDTARLVRQGRRRWPRDRDSARERANGGAPR
jgi:Holliday junction DNA helicase RuvA